jgi:hypothetical protein
MKTDLIYNLKSSGISEPHSLLNKYSSTGEESSVLGKMYMCILRLDSNLSSFLA